MFRHVAWDAARRIRKVPEWAGKPRPLSADATSAGIKRCGSWVRAAQLILIHGENTDHTLGGDTGASQTRIRMVYTTALLFGHGVPVMSEEDSVMEMIGKYFSELTSSTGRKRRPVRRGSVESCDETENNPPGMFCHHSFFSCLIGDKNTYKIFFHSEELILVFEYKEFISSSPGWGRIWRNCSWSEVSWSWLLTPHSCWCSLYL